MIARLRPTTVALACVAIVLAGAVIGRVTAAGSESRDPITPIVISPSASPEPTDEPTAEPDPPRTAETPQPVTPRPREYDDDDDDDDDDDSDDDSRDTDDD